MLVFYYHVFQGGCEGGVWVWHLAYAPFPRSHMCYYSQISSLVTNLTILSERQVLTDGYRLVLPDRKAYLELQGPKGINLVGVQLPVQATLDSAVAAISD